LWLSPHLAVYIGDVLIPVTHLINGSTIGQVTMDEVIDFHPEQTRHSVLAKEGMAAIPYLVEAARCRVSGLARRAPRAALAT
jgi:hypothetical protein